MRFKNKGIVATIAWALSVLVNPAVSEASWQFAGWYGGGAYPSVVPDTKVNGRFYLLSDVAGLWRSDDRGTKWNFITRGVDNLHTAVLAIAPSNNNVLYTGTKGGVHKSSDAGATWAALAGTKGVVTFKRPDNYRSIAVHHTDSNRVYAGTNTGWVYTSSNGSTWAKVGSYPFGSATPISALHLSNDNSTLIAASPLGLARCNPSTGTWTRMLTGTKAYDMMGVTYAGVETVYVTAGNKIAYSSDKGVSWSYTGTIPTGSAFRLYAKTDASGTRIFVGSQVNWSGDAYLSTNKGATWTNIERGVVHDTLGNPSRVWTKGLQKPLSVAIDPFNSNVLYWTDWWGVFRSDDGGLTWQERIKGAPNTVATDVVIGPTGSVYVGSMDNGLMKSNDAGVSYTALAPKSGLSSSSYTGHFWRVLVLGTTGQRVITTSSPWDVSVNQIAISNDGGASFAFVKAGLPATRPVVNTVWDKGYARAIAVDPKNDNKIYLGIDGDDGGGLYVSSNGGTSWTRSSGQPASRRIYNGLAVDPVTTTRLYWATVGNGGGVYRSENSGASWTKVFSGSAYVFDLAVSREGVVYAAADTGGPVLYVSKDRGTTWQLMKKFAGTGTCEAITVDPLNSKQIAVSTVKWDDYANNKIYLSKDGGVTWNDVSSDLPNGSGAAHMAFSRDGKFLYVSRYAGSVYRMPLDGSTVPPDPGPGPGSDTQAPNAPTALVGAVTSTQVILWWNAATDNVGVTGYRVYRDGTQIGTSASAKFYDTSVAAGSHQYQVKAVDAAGNLSVFGNTTTLNLSVKIGGSSVDTQAPSAPTGLAGSVAGNTVKVWWNPSSDNVGVVGYRVYRNGTQVGSTAATTFTNTGVPAGAHSYQVKAYDAAGNVSAGSNGTGANV